ncbi:MAG: hypothetical protein VCC00_04325 [Deltaproteobacteria bacterium]
MPRNESRWWSLAQGRPPRDAATLAEPPLGSEPLTALAWVLLSLAAATVILWVQARTSWYLAIDQFGYLSFARDLVLGQATHSSDVGELLNSFMPLHDSDALGQTYVMRGGELFSRYAPGFPLILAAVSALFGEPAVHDVNAVAMGLLLVVFAWLVARLLHSAWLGLAAAILATLLPNELLLWSISPLRDIPCHVVAFTALALLLPSRSGVLPGRARLMLAGFALGYAVSMRVDAILYLLPAIALVWLARPLPISAIASAAFAFLLGILPLLAYNQAATGNPFRPTQAMEFKALLSNIQPAAIVASVFAPRESHAAIPKNGPMQYRRLVQGGGFRLAHLQRTLPGNLRHFEAVFGPLGLGLGLLGALFSLRRPRLFFLTVPYICTSIVFFSFWTRPDSRYLAGAILLFTPLALYGSGKVLSLPGLLRERGRPGVALALALGIAALALAYGFNVNTAVRSALPWATFCWLAAGALGALIAATVGRAAAGQSFAIALALLLTLVFGWRTERSWGNQASFQAAEVAQAQQRFESFVPPGSIVYTSYRYGRPAENINYYTSSSAIYLEELLHWGMSQGAALKIPASTGHAVFLLVTPVEAERWRTNPWTASFLDAELVRDIRPGEARDFFVASPRHRGLHLQLVRLRIKSPG